MYFSKLQINENKFPIKIKKVHQAILFQTLRHNLSLIDSKNSINTINTKRMFLLNMKVTPSRRQEARLSLNSFTLFLTLLNPQRKVVVLP